MLKEAGMLSRSQRARANRELGAVTRKHTGCFSRHPETRPRKEAASEQAPRVKEDPLLGRRKSQGQGGQPREGSHCTDGQSEALGEEMTFPRSHRRDCEPLHSE